MRRPIYRVGFNEDYRPLSFELDESLFDHADVTLDLRTDLLRMFKACTPRTWQHCRT